MKTIFTIIALLIFSIGFCQVGELTGEITDSNNIGFPGLTIKLLKDGNLISETQTDFDGKYSFKNVTNGIYSIRISALGMREEKVENVLLEDKIKVINLTYPKPCVDKTKKVCPKGHKSNIIPIVYGLPTKKTIEKAEKKKIKLGGCAQYCEKWHCVEHDLDF